MYRLPFLAQILSLRAAFGCNKTMGAGYYVVLEKQIDGLDTAMDGKLPMHWLIIVVADETFTEFANT